MSGYFPFHTGLQHSVILWGQKVGLPEQLTILPQALKDRGYATHAIGKWHLGYCKWEYTPTERGFDSFLGFYNADETYYGHDAYGGYDFRRDRIVDFEHAGQYSTDVFADRAVDVIASHNASQPLFLYLPFQSVHYPLQVPQSYEDEYCSEIENGTRRTFCGMAASMDEAIGRVTDRLEELGYLDNALLIFTSDNGGGPEVGGSNWPLRGAKDTLWEGGNRAVSFLYSKNLFQNTGTVHDGMMHAVDWFPTLMTLVDGETPEGIDGVSQWESIVNETDSPRTEFVYNIDDIDNNAAIRMGDWKLIQGNPGSMNGWYPASGDGMETEQADNSTEYLHSDDLLLFNVKDDPEEREDVKKAHPFVLRRLMKRLEEWKKGMVPANIPREDPASNPMNFDGVWSPGWC
ncbi:arylsulfatase J-like [Littorina saxatilis]|uniref:Sulfatase N-terminal domain-containing protein n=1 Tax=Littorina saxatilis TaxID=31220 RepID=A0AAN9B3C7_9CAEN